MQGYISRSRLYDATYHYYSKAFATFFPSSSAFVFLWQWCNSFSCVWSRQVSSSCVGELSSSFKLTRLANPYVNIIRSPRPFLVALDSPITYNELWVYTLHNLTTPISRQQEHRNFLFMQFLPLQLTRYSNFQNYLPNFLLTTCQRLLVFQLVIRLFKP